MPVEMVDGSDVHTAQLDGKVAFATWFYNVGDLAVNVMYALPGEQRQGLEVAWQPPHGSSAATFHAGFEQRSSHRASRLGMTGFRQATFTYRRADQGRKTRPLRADQYATLNVGPSSGLVLRWS